MTNKTNKILGVAFLFQFVTSLTSGMLQKNILFNTEDITLIFSSLISHSQCLQICLFLDMLTVLGVIFLGVALYQSMKEVNALRALTGMAFYLLEGVLHIMSKLKGIELLHLGSSYQSTANPLILDTAERLLEMKNIEESLMMMAFCAGAILLYSLLTPSKTAPRWLSLWGLITVSFLALWTVLGFFGIEVPFFLYLPYVPFEAFIGIWLLGSKSNA